MAPKPKKTDAPPPPVEEDLGDLPEYEFTFSPVVVNTVLAEDLDQGAVDEWVYEKENIAAPLSIADTLAEVVAAAESELAIAVAAAKQSDAEKATEKGAEFK